jgi:hypothetical protein
MTALPLHTLVHVAERPALDPLAFVRALFRDLPAGAVAWGARIPGDPLAAERRHWFGFPIVRGARLGPLFPDNLNDYIVVSSFVIGGRRRKSDFAALHAVMLDDIGTKVRPAAVRLRLSAAVATSPGNWQGWYFLTEPEHDRLRAETLINGLIDSGLANGHDPGMSAVTRYGRAPFGINGKRGGEFAVRLALLEPAQRYTIAEIADAYGLDMTPRPQRPALVRPLPGGWGSRDVLAILDAAGMVLRDRGDVIDIRCPWIADHTDRTETGTAVGVLDGGGVWFKCHHGHCLNRRASDLFRFAQMLASAAQRQREAS